LVLKFFCFVQRSGIDHHFARQHGQPTFSGGLLPIFDSSQCSQTAHAYARALSSYAYPWDAQSWQRCDFFIAFQFLVVKVLRVIFLNFFFGGSHNPFKHSGMPNPGTFPFQKIEITCRDSTKMVISDNELNQALQYAATEGIPDLASWIHNHMQLEHRPPTIHAPRELLVSLYVVHLSFLHACVCLILCISMNDLSFHTNGHVSQYM
jgi:hypothetical protein